MLFEQNYPSTSNPDENQSNIAGWVFVVLCVIAVFIIYSNEQQQDPKAKLNINLPVAAVEFRRIKSQEKCLIITTMVAS